MLTCLITSGPVRPVGLTATKDRDSSSTQFAILREASPSMTRTGAKATLGSCWTMVSLTWKMTRTTSHWTWKSPCMIRCLPRKPRLSMVDAGDAITSWLTTRKKFLSRCSRSSVMSCTLDPPPNLPQSSGVPRRNWKTRWSASRMARLTLMMRLMRFSRQKT